MAYYPAANSLAEAFNKTIRKLLKKFVSKSQRDWDNKLGSIIVDDSSGKTIAVEHMMLDEFDHIWCLYFLQGK